MKWIGAVLIILACGGMGIFMASAYRYEERLLQQFLGSLRWMLCELQCRGVDLPELFRRGSERTGGIMGQLYGRMGLELSKRVAPDARTCMEIALDGVRLPEKLRELALALGNSVGEFHLEGQLQQLESVLADCSRILEEHRRCADGRIRIYQTLGLCGGLALAILLL